MELKDVADLFFKIRDSVYFYLNFYIVGLAAVLTWMVSLKEKLDPKARIIASILYAIFSGICLISLDRQYSLLEASRLEFLRLMNASQQEFLLYELIGNRSYTIPHIAALLIIFIVCVMGIVFINIYGRKKSVLNKNDENNDNV